MISVNIATHKKREKFLKQTLMSLIEQNTKPDIINVYFNDYDPPQWVFDLDKVINPITGKDLGAAAKFYSSEAQESGVYLTMDDDLVAMPAYVGYLVDMAYKLPDGVVGLHGTTYGKKPIKSYYTDKSKIIHYCYSGLGEHTYVDMLGTGCIAFLSANKNKPVLSDFKAKNSTDPYMYKLAKERSMPLLCLRRSANFVKEIHGSQITAIWKGVQKDDSEQTKIINSVSNAYIVKGKAVDSSKYKDAAIEWYHMKKIADTFKKDLNVVEFGSGVSTEYFSKFPIELSSFEHNEKYVTEKNIYRPIKNGWYDLKGKDKETIKSAQVLIVDGPIGSTGERYNIPDWVIESIDSKAIIFVDDCHRKKDLELARKIAKMKGMSLQLICGKQKVIAKIK